MSLKINNNTITISDLTGGNSDAKYFNSNLAQLVPNKTGYKLFGSPLQRQQLKQFVNDSFAHNINYEPKITNIVNSGDNTSFYTTEQSTHYIYSSFSTSKYIKLLNAFKPENNSWSITMHIKTPANFNYANQFLGSHSSYFKTVGGEFGTNQFFGCGITSDGSSWDIGWIWGTTTLITNTWYYYKLSFTGTQYKLEIRKEGDINYTLEGVIDSTTPIYQANDSIICFGHQGSGYLRGELDLTATKINIGDNVWFDGATAIQDTDYTIVGSPTKTEEIIEEYEYIPFTFSFDINSSTFTQGTKYLLEHPNLIQVKTENNDLYFNFPWRNNNWCNVASQKKMFYAYTDVNGNTIYTPDENLQGTYKSLNTNDFDNFDSAISNSGIASFDTGNTIKSKTGLFGTGYKDWTMVLTLGNQDFLSWTPFFAFEDSNSPFFIGRWMQWGRTRLLSYDNSWSIEAWAAEVPRDNSGFLTFIIKGSDTNTWFENHRQDGLPWSTGKPANFTGSKIYFGDNQFELDLTSSYFIVNGVKTTLAIFDTTSQFYNSSFQKITGATAEHYNDVIVVNGTTYTRDTSKDGIKNVPVLITGTNTISLIASDSQGGTTEADQIKLNVNNHNFTLVASGENMPLITTGVLGYKEDLVF